MCVGTRMGYWLQLSGLEGPDYPLTAPSIGPCTAVCGAEVSLEEATALVRMLLPA